MRYHFLNVIYLIWNLNSYFSVNFMGNVFKIYHQKLATDSSYTLLWNFFIENADFTHSKKEFLIWNTRVFLYEWYLMIEN